MVLLFMHPECALECERCSTISKTTNQLGCSMNTAEVIFQMFVFDELLVAILFDTSKRLLKVVGSHHVLLQILFLSKLLCTTWLRASMRCFFIVHHSNVHSQIAAVTELLQALVTLIWLFFVVHRLNVLAQIALLAELLQTLATLILLHFLVHHVDMSVQMVLVDLLSHSQFCNLDLNIVDLPHVQPVFFANCAQR